MNTILHTNTELAERLGCLQNVDKKLISYEGMEYGRYENVNLFNLPYVDVDVSEKFDYAEKDDLAIVICIWENQTEVNRADRHLYAKSAVYSALSLIENTDVQETGTKIYFVLNAGISDITLAYLRAANIPDENILYAPLTQSGVAIQFNFLFRIDCLSHEKLRAKKRVLVVNSSIYAFYRKKTHLMKQLIDTKTPLILSCNADDVNHNVWKLELLRYEAAEKLDVFYKDLAAYMGISEAEVKFLTSDENKACSPSFDGAIWSITTELANSKGMLHHLKQAYEKSVFFTDETFLLTWIWMHQTPYSVFPFELESVYRKYFYGVTDPHVPYDDGNPKADAAYLDYRKSFEKRMKGLSR
ncbi:MAG: hypothetical protein OXN27_04445 [Candidatus Poribacteria bacterium]|nr:hypothetical protein [Candidatus Poribacteria bacterium]